LGAADPAFAARGWARTRVEDIASAAGVSNATAYNHFPSKHALIGHVYAPLVQTLRTQAYRDIAAGRPVVPALIDHLRALVGSPGATAGSPPRSRPGSPTTRSRSDAPRTRTTRTTRACSLRSATSRSS
jgi:AcrR family transcriptional regulator